MNIRTFWMILIKVLGLSLLLSGLVVVPSFFSTFLFSFVESPLLPVTVMLFITVGVYLFVLWLFLFRTSRLIDVLRLDKSFEEERIGLDVKAGTVLRIAVIVTGGVVLIDALPELCKQMFVYVRERNLSYANPTSGWIVFHLAKSFIGYLLLTRNKPIVAWINRAARQESE